MPKPYSHDLRGRALEACDEGERPGSVAKRLRIGRASVYLWLKQRREEGCDCPKKMGGGPQPVIRDAAEANPMCMFQFWTSWAKASGGRLSRWQSRTAIVWPASLRSQRAIRCHTSRARVCLAW